MRVVNFSVNLPRGSKMVYLEPIGDTHVGSFAFARDKLLDRIDEIKREKERIWIGMGDYLDNIRPWRRSRPDLRWELSLLKGNPNWLEQWDDFVSMVKPIKDKCIGLLWGNHEFSTFEEQEFERMVKKDLGVPFLGSRAFVILTVNGSGITKREWSILAVHGDFSGDTKGGALNRMKQLSQTIVANIYLYAHTHFKATDKGERIYIRKNGNNVRIEREPTISVLTGGFIDPYYIGADTYFDKKPRGRDIRVGTVTVLIDPVEVKLYAVE